MKAYMSEPGKQYDRIQRSIEKPTFEAIAEAKRILAETGEDSSKNAWKVSEVYLASMEVHDALAEALTNFLKD